MSIYSEIFLNDFKYIAIYFTSEENEQLPRVKHVIFPNMSNDSCTFTICFETVKVQFSLDLWGNSYLFSKSEIRYFSQQV